MTASSVDRQLELAGGRLCRRVVGGVLGADVVQLGGELVEVDAGVGEHLRRGTVWLLQDRLQDVVAADRCLAGELRSQRQHLVCCRRTACAVSLAGRPVTRLRVSTSPRIRSSGCLSARICAAMPSPSRSRPSRMCSVPM